MTNEPDRLRKKFPDISTRAWEHPADRTALVALRSLTGFDTILKTLSGLLAERQHRLLYLASAIRVDDLQFGYLDELRRDCLSVLDSAGASAATGGKYSAPEMFVMQDPAVNAFTIGMDRPFIVLTTGLIDLMDREELRFVIGHEIGHALSGHAVYRTMMMHLMRLANGLGWMPVGGWAIRAIVAALMEWQRKSELSGDRAGMLCTQDFEAAIRVHMKTAGGARLSAMNTTAFLGQAAEYERAGDLRDGVLKLLNLELQSHPFSVLRAAELRRWVREGSYRDILAGDYPRRSDDRATNLGEEIKGAARSYRDSFDQSEDPLVKTVRDVGKTFGSAAATVSDAFGEAVGNLGSRFADWRVNRDPKDG